MATNGITFIESFVKIVGNEIEFSSAYGLLFLVRMGEFFESCLFVYRLWKLAIARVHFLKVYNN